MKKRLILCIVVIFVQSSLLLADTVLKTVKNSLAEIDSKMGKISLELLRTWGDDSEKDHIFKAPVDIALDKNDNVYIVDSALHCIKVFDSGGRFIREIGRRGQGPGDTLAPSHIAIAPDDTIWVLEYGNRRIQVFSETGTSLAILKTVSGIWSNLVFPAKNQVAFINHTITKKGDGLITVIDRTGIEIPNIGKHILLPLIELPWAGGKYDSVNLAFNRKTQEYYIAYIRTQMIHLLKKTGEISTVIFYETPINNLKWAWEPGRRNFNIIEKKKQYSECIDLEVDHTGRLFTVVSTRPPKENERTSIISNTSTFSFRPNKEDYSEKTDMYRLMVFGTDGKILAAKQLDVFCDEIYINNDRIFMVDKTFAQVVYEYRYKIED